MTTLRQEMIGELREALGELEKPSVEDDQIEFTLFGMDYSYSSNDLDSAQYYKLITNMRKLK